MAGRLGAAAYARMQPHDWQLDDHLRPPERLDPVPELSEDGCQGIRFQGPDWQGNNTSVFAWLGLPENATPDNPVPAVVLVHGGLGTAYAKWVRLWTARGYAAIALDHCGCVPVKQEQGGFKVLPDGGPPGFGGFDQTDLPTKDRWNHHAVANVIRAHSLIRSLPEVDSNRTAITGISWGGYLTTLVTALDHRFRCAVPVYSCGFLDQSPIMGASLETLTAAHQCEWMQRWDPQHFLPRIRCPLLFVAGTLEKHFIPPIWSPSTQLPTTSVTRSFQIGLKHSHEAGWAPAEIASFIDHHIQQSDPLPQLGLITEQSGQLHCQSDLLPEQSQIQLAWTCDKQATWKEQEWQWSPAQQTARGLQAPIPDKAIAAFFSVVTPQQLTSTSNLWFADPSILPQHSIETI